MLATTVSYSQKDLKQVQKLVTLEETRQHIEYLSSDEMRGRDTGSPEIEEAAQYLASHFEKSGVKKHNGTYFQTVGLTKVYPQTESTLKADTLQLKHGGEMIVRGGDSGEINAEVVLANYGLEGDYEGLDVDGKVVVVKFGSEEDQSVRVGFGLRADKVALAEEHGAVAVIELYQSVGMPWSRLAGYFNSPSITLDQGESNYPVPFIWVNDPRNINLNFFENYEGKISINVEGPESEDISGKNVFGIIEGTDPDLKDEYLIITAHYDHVGVGRAVNGDSIYNGARDNAIGTVAMMNAAKFLAKNPPRRSVAVLAVTAEEKGLLGSAWYADHPLIPMDKVIFDLNCDGAGYNDTSMASVVGLERSTVDPILKSAVEDAGLQLGGDPAPEQGFFDRSDNVNFARQGVPCINMSPGLAEFNQEILKYYHQPADEASSLDFDYLHKFNEAFVLTALRIANMDEAPFWKEGDKYEEAGKKLYNR